MDNIRLHQFAMLPYGKQEQYVQVLQFVKPVARLGKHKAKSFQEMTYNDVLMLKKLASTDAYVPMFDIVFGINENELNMTRIKEFFQAFNWIRDEVKRIIKVEKRELGSEPDPDMVEAGISRLDRFGDMNAVIPMSIDYGVHPDVILGWQYSVVFMLLRHKKISGEIDRNYMEIMRKKQS